ncbi:3-oxo-5-alpha-steroid 4-dehydrogenase-domain-containing protein [Tuber borchii]|uniref:3-oxo-5-alpha-steroid 4-dehydrogenase-domain-containing protein n=1 Tax=Tuber borchii TaxID=42251 RepID=A0A2T7A9J2_TUBBO|nr:3-oxo-5-alpha-steroid 4-dehydrogenase-domain-containing protein [Tuber borchii]
MQIMDLLRSGGFIPLTRHSWQLLLRYWKYFPLVAPLQLALPEFYPAGKTSYTSIFNVPGKLGWILMELCSPLTLLYTIYTNPERTGGLPKIHIWLATLYCMHYFHRALLSPILNPSMGPMNLIMVIAGVVFNIINGSAIGGWLGGYGSAADVPVWQISIGSAVFILGLWGNMYHEEILREIRRDKSFDKNAQREGRVVTSNGRVYKIPEGGLFKWVWNPHYISEWIEWSGYVIAGGGIVNFLPATLFVINELATMLPRAIQQKRWYEKKFNKNILPKRKAAIPGII